MMNHLYMILINFQKLFMVAYLTEGGAAGHMAHPWDDHGLTFNDMKEIVSCIRRPFRY
jgi:hypothetical protein